MADVTGYQADTPVGITGLTTAGVPTTPVNSANGQLLTQDTLFTGGQYRAQSVTTTAAPALGAATILVNRKVLIISPTNGTIYWGTNASVTTTTGMPLFKNQKISVSITDALNVYLISAGTVDVRIVELA